MMTRVILFRTFIAVSLSAGVVATGVILWTVAQVRDGDREPPTSLAAATAPLDSLPERLPPVRLEPPGEGDAGWRLSKLPPLDTAMSSQTTGAIEPETRISVAVAPPPPPPAQTEPPAPAVRVIPIAPATSSRVAAPPVQSAPAPAEAPAIQPPRPASVVEPQRAPAPERQSAPSAERPPAEPPRATALVEPQRSFAPPQQAPVLQSFEAPPSSAAAGGGLRPAEPARDTTETPSSPVRPRVEARADTGRADTGRADTARADSGSADAASNLVDLNTGTLEQLNSLKGGGRIGRAIINGRPYRNVEDLLRKKVLSRSTYETIKDQVTVR